MPSILDRISFKNSAVIIAATLAVTVQYVQANEDDTVARKKLLEQQKEQITHASDYKTQSTQKERKILSTEIKKDDAVSKTKSDDSNSN